MFLGSITTGVPIPECESDASSSQVTLGLGEDFTWSLDNLTSGSPSRDTQEGMGHPSRHLTQSSRRGCSCHHGWGSLCCLERRPPKQLPSPREQASRNTGFLHHLRRAPATEDRRKCFVVFTPPSDP